MHILILSLGLIPIAPALITAVAHLIICGPSGRTKHGVK